MLKLIASRILAAVPTLFGVLVATFLIVHLIPGDPISAILGDEATEEQIQTTREALGLNDPLYVQFANYLTQVLQGDLGTSISGRQPVADQIMARLPATISLAIAGVIASVIIGIPLGMLAATRRGGKTDFSALLFTTVGEAAPAFWTGILLSTVFAITLGWLPATGAGTPGDTWSVIRSLILPATALGLAGMALIARITRSSMLEVLNEDYVRTARAKGVREWVVITRHALRNAAIPVVTVIGLNFGVLLGGTVVMETVFARPGIGSLLVNAIFARDYPVVQGVTLVIAVSFVLVNLVTDIVYRFLDPRLRDEVTSKA
ncbi:ABC transporter permease [Nesterenkonia ebinurensis]|uniref:ABC transporter permease n=1 Tax=Nesterenkonia ebinurensis TaxID=2608252 RepID=UPI00123E406C|nr:ABC transporter permease [Nesterenkonia ebinurensis]